jgi:hypothetical protein
MKKRVAIPLSIFLGLLFWFIVLAIIGSRMEPQQRQQQVEQPETVSQTTPEPEPEAPQSVVAEPRRQEIPARQQNISDFEFEIDEANKTVTITGYKGRSKKVIMPSVINGMPVTAISSTGRAVGGDENTRRIKRMQRITSIIIPEGVLEIKNYTFHDCTKLNSVTLPTTLIKIGAFAFTGCSFTHIELPDNLKEISFNAFMGCSRLVKINIPNSVSYIGGKAFMDCKNLISVSIPQSVEKIGMEAFAYCPNLKTINLSKRVNLSELVFDKGINIVYTD